MAESASTVMTPLIKGTQVRFTIMRGFTFTDADTMMITAATGDIERKRFDMHSIGSAMRIGLIPALSAICGMSSMKL